jgi:hypothetical protein
MFPPGRFSTMTCWPRRFVRLSLIARNVVSVIEPGARGTMILIGLSG